ncbi:MAG: hypothetical protein CL941_05160 [Desulfobacter sp.]|nr:hypothetical protein [Desulfobacter sp.]
MNNLFAERTQASECVLISAAMAFSVVTSHTIPMLFQVAINGIITKVGNPAISLSRLLPHFFLFELQTAILI